MPTFVVHASFMLYCSCWLRATFFINLGDMIAVSIVDLLADLSIKNFPGSFCNHHFLRMLAIVGRGHHYAAYDAGNIRA